jgi:DNA-binding NarL/FixJ family response regulator
MTTPESVVSANVKATKSRILVVDDHPLIRAGLGQLINRQSDMIYCGDAECIPDAIREIALHNPHLAIIDLCLGDEDGLDLVKYLTENLPRLRMLVLSQMDETVYAERALKAGAHGFIAKAEPASELLAALRKVLAGQLYVSQKIATMALRRLVQERPSSRGSNLPSLTNRELAVLKAAGIGKTSREIAS